LSWRAIYPARLRFSNRQHHFCGLPTAKQWITAGKFSCLTNRKIVNWQQSYAPASPHFGQVSGNLPVPPGHHRSRPAITFNPRAATNPAIMKSILHLSVLFTLFVLSPCRSFAADWWTLSDQDFAKQYGKQAISAAIKDQSSVAWMLFARVNQPAQNQGQNVTQWEMWPSNEDTFSPAVGLFKAQSKVRTRPHLQPPKTVKIAGKTRAAHLFGLPPSGGGEEVTRNLDSYNFITQNGLQTLAGVKTFLTSPNPKVDLPIGAVEIKAVWVPGATAGAYQFKGTTGTYSLLGLHIMAKVQPGPADPFSSEDPSWFWTTFEFKDNPGLANAQSFLTYKDALPPADATNLLTQAGLGQSAFTNYKCNGTQIRFSDATNKKILLGNTKMENFNFTPTNAASPAQWKTWNISCHTCHASASANPKNANNFFFPFDVQVGQGAGKIPAGQMKGYQALDFIWSIPFNAQ
jgi:hypothetical protein